MWRLAETCANGVFASCRNYYVYTATARAEARPEQRRMTPISVQFVRQTDRQLTRGHVHNDYHINNKIQPVHHLTYNLHSGHNRSTEVSSPNPQPLLHRPLLPLPINILLRGAGAGALELGRNRRLLIHLRLRRSLHRILLRWLLQSMRHAELTPLLRILHAPLALLPRLQRRMLDMHAENRQRLRHRRDRMRQQRRPRRQQMRKRRGRPEVGREGEGCQGGEDALSPELACPPSLHPTVERDNWGEQGGERTMAIQM